MIGRRTEAKARYYQSAGLDPTSVSPWIELLNLVKEETGVKSELIQVLQAILYHQERASQLEDYERLEFERLLNSFDD